MKNIAYINEHFIEQNELCELAKISLEEFELLQQKELVPLCSYEITHSYQIKSPLGDEHSITEIKKYFAKNTLDIIKQNKNQKNNDSFKEKHKEDFIQEMRKGKDYSNEELEETFSTAWNFYLQGVYGICLLEPNFINIAKKQNLCLI